ncbi:MAG: lamin tail domain-containing protein [Deltaproteobacteria bacterium]|nr:lamin tail domain-containing protein [Deltaproteobacteria bacterium]
MLKKLIILSVLSLSFMSIGCDPDDKETKEVCNNGEDDDGDGYIDCLDVECLSQIGGPDGQLCQSTETRCADDFDNDGDGATDCEDSDCADSTDCGGQVEDCTDGEDNDGDDAIDCADSDCVGETGPDGVACEATEVTCNDDKDNDGDGDTDCDDTDCENDEYCGGTPVENCTNGEDDDDDTFIDCADSDCIGQTGPDGVACEATEVTCDDFKDNDGDGDTDCDDTDCATAGNCVTGEICDNNQDDDEDGLVDCADAECDGETNADGVTCESTEISCGDGEDNDGDTLVDCADPDCIASCISAGDLVITEIMKDPNIVEDDAGEWIEIYNASSAAIDLRGLVLYSGTTTHTIASANPVTVDSGAYFVMGFESDTGLNGNVPVGYVYTGVILSNGDDDIGIRTGTGTVIDYVAYTEAEFPDFSGMALSLDRDHTNATDNDTGSNWCTANVKYNSDDYGTPGSANPSCTRESDCENSTDDDGNGVADCDDVACAYASICTTGEIPVPSSLIITEIMANPVSGSSDLEWFEIFNTSGSPVELNGLTVCDDATEGHCFIVDFGTSYPLTAGEYALFARNGSLLPAGIVADYTYGTTIYLNDSPSTSYPEAINLFANGALIDGVYFDTTWSALTEGASMSFSPNAPHTATGNNDKANWCAGVDLYDSTNTLYGTPGTANPACAMETICDDSSDNDSDGLTDCQDPDCDGLAGPGGITCEAAETTCDDGNDNDGDGMVDCADSDCDGLTGPDSVACELSETTCNDGIDNDGDTLVDCADPDCDGLMGPGGIACVVAPMTLYFSEYIEGGSNNKALEIYNPFPTAFDLSTCTVNLYSNGSETPSYDEALSGSLAAGDVFVICNSSSVTAILDVCDLESTVTYFNGDDAVELVCGGVTVDVIGQIGTDPGSYWGSGDTATVNKTLVRKCGISSGDADGSDAFDPVSEWDGYAQDTFTYLGSHTPVCK